MILPPGSFKPLRPEAKKPATRRNAGFFVGVKVAGIKNLSALAGSFNPRPYSRDGPAFLFSVSQPQC